MHRRSKFAQKVHGLRAKLYNAKRYKEKAQMRKAFYPDEDDWKELVYLRSRQFMSAAIGGLAEAQ